MFIFKSTKDFLYKYVISVRISVHFFQPGKQIWLHVPVCKNQYEKCVFVYERWNNG